EDPHHQAVVMTGGNLGAPVGAVDAVVILHQDVGVQIQSVAVLVDGGGQAFDLQAGDVVHIGLDVGADVPHAVGNAGEFGVLPPDGQVLLGPLLGLQLVDEPVLHILGVDGGDLADLAGGDHVLHNPAHGVAGIGIG